MPALSSDELKDISEVTVDENITKIASLQVGSQEVTPGNWFNCLKYVVIEQGQPGDPSTSPNPLLFSICGMLGDSTNP